MPSCSTHSDPPTLTPDLSRHSEGAVGVSLALDEDYDSLVADAVRLKMWNARLKADLCSAAGCEPQRVQIVGVQRSSGVIVDINFLPGPGLPSADLAAELASQVASPTSILRTSDTTASVQRADVHNGPVAPPNSFATAPKAGASPTAVGRAPSPPQERGSQPQPEQKAMPADKAGVGLVLREDGAGRQVAEPTSKQTSKHTHKQTDKQTNKQTIGPSRAHAPPGLLPDAPRLTLEAGRSTPLVMPLPHPSGTRLPRWFAGSCPARAPQHAPSLVLATFSSGSTTSWSRGPML